MKFDLTPAQRLRFKRFCTVVATETPIRFCELLFVSLVFSLVLQVLGSLQVFAAAESFMALQTLVLLAFIIVQIWLCRRSSQKTRYFPRYYVSNILAFLLYALFSWVIFRVLGLAAFMLTFRIVFCLTMTVANSVSVGLALVVVFYLAHLALICLSPQKLLFFFFH